MNPGDINFLSGIQSEGLQIFFVLLLSFLIGIQREAQKNNPDHFSFGGVRTFPIIGLIGYGISLLAGADLVLVFYGFTVIAAFLLLAYWHKISASGFAGVTSEMSGLATYLIGVLVNHDLLWVATTITVTSLILLELKEFLEGLANKIEAADIFSFTKFLLLSAVILPILPNLPYTQFQINPFKTWLVVIAVSGISYISYVLQRLKKGGGGILLAAALGGIYSSTVTTIALATQSKNEACERIFSGGILIASGMMYVRLVVLLAIFNEPLMLRLALPFLSLALVSLSCGFFWARSENNYPSQISKDTKIKNPLEISTALLFALIFIFMLIVTYYSSQYLGSAGIYVLSAIMGITDVDPFLMSLTQTSPSGYSPLIAVNAILIATASNNFVKGIYAYAFSSKKTGQQSLLFLTVLAILGLMPLFFI